MRLIESRQQGREMTKNLTDQKMAATYSALSATAARNAMGSQQAKKKGAFGTAGLLEAIAESERIQARRALVYLRGKVPDLPSHINRLIEQKKQASSPKAAQSLYISQIVTGGSGCRKNDRFSATVFPCAGGRRRLS